MILLCVIYKNVKNTLELSQFENGTKTFESHKVSLLIRTSYCISE